MAPANHFVLYSVVLVAKKMFFLVRFRGPLLSEYNNELYELRTLGMELLKRIISCPFWLVGLMGFVFYTQFLYNCYYLFSILNFIM